MGHKKKKNQQGIKNTHWKKIMTENFPNMVKEKVTQVQEAQSGTMQWVQRK